MSKFSVILPVLNNEKLLKKCLENLLSQSHKELEIICVDDGSSDNSLHILQEFSQKDNRVKVMTQIQSGIANAKNLALASATGDYCYFANPSDLVAPNLFEYADTLFSTFNMDYFCFGSKVVKDEGAITVNTQKEQEALLFHCDGLFDAEFEITQKAGCVIFNKIFKMSVIKTNNITFPTNYEFDDFAFVWLYNFISNRVYFDDCIYHYHKVYADIQDKNYNYAISYLHNWCYMCEQLNCVKGLIEKNYDSLVELLNFCSAKAKSLVKPTEKHKIEKVKQEYKDKLEQVMLNAEKERQRIKQLEFEREKQTEKYTYDKEVEVPVETKKTFFQKIYSVLPDVYRKDCKILTILGLEILLRNKN